MSISVSLMLHRLASCAASAIVALSLVATPAAAQSTNPKIVKKVPLDFPPAALRKGIDRGVLKTRVSIDAAGAPTEVTVLETEPAKAKILNETVIEALNKWRWEAQGKPSSFELQIVFTAE